MNLRGKWNANFLENLKEKLELKLRLMLIKMLNFILYFIFIRFKSKGVSLHLPYNDQLQVEVPVDVQKFIRSWKNGRYFPCEPALIRPPDVRRVIPLSYLDRMVEFADLVEQHNATAFILCGTLLGL
jgi:hypothetical protein